MMFNISKKISLLALFSTCLFSQTIFADDFNEKTLRKKQRALNRDIRNFIKEYNWSDTYRLKSLFFDITKTIREIKEEGKAVDIQRLEDLMYFFLNGLNQISCSRERKCKKLKIKIKNDLESYYDLAKQLYGF